ncbi:MAG: PBP1A family penicillin-binding protein [Acidobacteria bacterium]|nr:PBP1A family penicillin-binding protein [Acidobacteriota bacterium]
MVRLKGHSKATIVAEAVVGLLFAGLIFVGFAGIYYFVYFVRLYETRLKYQSPETTAVYTRPYEIKTGQKLSRAALKDRLQRAGYREISGDELASPSDWYFQSEESPSVIQFGHLNPLAVNVREEYAVVFSGAAIHTIRQSGIETNSAFIKPEFISNLFGPSLQKKRRLSFEELPPQLINAVLAAEDERFFSHQGFDLVAIIRAGFANLLNRDQLQGASTLTQQFIKNYFLTPKRNLKRKLEELYLAALLEKRLTKKQIFELYANEVYLGQVGSFSILGFGEGARTFFGKNVDELTIDEAAFLAGIIQAPNRHSPYQNKEAAVQRRNHILELMWRKKLLTEKEKDAALKAPLQLQPHRRRGQAEALFFVDYVHEALDKEWPEWRKNLRNFEIYTTLDIDLQKAANEAVAKGMEQVKKRLGRRRNIQPEAALVALDPKTGEVLAMVGGSNYSQSQFNRAIRAYRQPGSTFKSFVYAAALEKSLEHHNPQYTLSSSFVDEPYTFFYENKQYSPSNFGEKYYGRVTLRRALALSLNVATVKLAEQIGFDSVADLSNRAGFSHELKPYPSVALGTFEVSLLELAQAYTAFANNGQVVLAHPLKGFRKGGVFETVAGPVPQSVIHPETAFLITSALQSVVNEGTGAGVRGMGFYLPAAGKTGSSDDSWFVGYTPDLLCAVWVGRDELKPVYLGGAQAALPIWVHFMIRAQQLGRLSGRDFQMPPNIVAVAIDPDTNLLAWHNCERVRTEYYIRGTQPTAYCNEEFEDAEEFSTDVAASESEESDTPASSQDGFWGRVWGVLR